MKKLYLYVYFVFIAIYLAKIVQRFMYGPV